MVGTIEAQCHIRSNDTYMVISYNYYTITYSVWYTYVAIPDGEGVIARLGIAISMMDVTDGEKNDILYMSDATIVDGTYVSLL